MDRQQWLQQRKKGIGGSDAASILGVNPFSSPLQVYLDKTTDIINDNEKEYLYWGTLLEDLVRDEFFKRTSKKMKEGIPFIKSKDYDFIFANVDSLIEGEEAGLECKTTNAFSIKEWDNDVPIYYVIQCHHYMYVTGFKKWYIAVLIGGNTFSWAIIERDEDLIKKIVNAEINFWKNNVLKGIAPEASNNDSETLGELYNQPTEDILTINDESFDKYLTYYLEDKKNLKYYTDLVKTKENVIKQKLGNHQFALCNSHKISWKEIESKRFDTNKFKNDHFELYEEYLKKSSYRKFGIKGGN